MRGITLIVTFSLYGRRGLVSLLEELSIQPLPILDMAIAGNKNQCWHQLARLILSSITVASTVMLTT